MLQEKSARPEKERSAAAETMLERSPTRCPYCHSECGPEEPQVAVCQGCLSRHHAACWREGGDRCASCSGTRALAPAPKRVAVAPAHLELLRRGLARQAIEQVVAKNGVTPEQAMEALLEATGRELERARTGPLGLPPATLVALVTIVMVFLIPIIAIILGR